MGNEKMKQGDEPRMHDSLKVMAGKLAGMAGTVEKIEGENITLAISGSRNGKPVEVVQTFNVKALGRL
jgi:transcription antitermination factor NusG